MHLLTYPCIHWPDISDSADSFDESSQQQSSQGRYSGIYDVPDVQQRGVAVKPLNPDHHNKGFNPYDETASQVSVPDKLLFFCIYHIVAYCYQHCNLKYSTEYSSPLR